MEITIFAKRRTGKDGKNFYSYLSTITNKAGETRTVTVKFRESAPNLKPEFCPCNFVVTKDNCILSKKTYTREDTGEPAESYTLWVSDWVKGSDYVDHSMDDYF